MPLSTSMFSFFVLVLFTTSANGFLSYKPKHGGPSSYDATLHRMKWWSKGTEALPPTDEYLLFSIDAGGLNNIRLGWEIAGLVAQYTHRTLVLPPAHRMYLLDFGAGKFSPNLPDGWERTFSRRTLVEDLINLRQLKANLPTLTAEEFENRTSLTWDKARMQAQMLPKREDPDKCQMSEYATVSGKFLFLDGDRREGFDCTEWWIQGSPRPAFRSEMNETNWALLTHGFVWHYDAFRIAAKAVDYLGLFNYVALHARYGDFAEKQATDRASNILDHWSSYIKAGTTLYVATDQPSELRGLAPAGVKVISWEDFFTDETGYLLRDIKGKYTPERWFKLTGLVEELICAYAKLFIGTDRSSFSGHIQRMRIHAEPPVERRLVHTDGDPFLQGSAGRAVEVPRAAIDAEITAWKKRDSRHKFRPLDRLVGKRFL